MATEPTIKDYIRGVFTANDSVIKNAPKKSYTYKPDGTVDKVYIEYPSPKKKPVKHTIN